MTDWGGFDAEKAVREAWTGHEHGTDEHVAGLGFACATCHANTVAALQRTYAAGIEAAAGLTARRYEDHREDGCGLCGVLRDLEKQIRALLPSGKEPGR